MREMCRKVASPCTSPCTQILDSTLLILPRVIEQYMSALQGADGPLDSFLADAK